MSNIFYIEYNGLYQSPSVVAIYFFLNFIFIYKYIITELFYMLMIYSYMYGFIMWSSIC